MISPLRDVRQRVDGNEPLFKGDNETEIEGEDYCVNAESGYTGTPVVTQVSDMLAAHLRQRQSLRAVSVGARVAGAYYLAGTLRRYYAAYKSTPSIIGVNLGAVGAVVEASTKPEWVPGITSVEIVDLVLYDNFGRVVERFPDIRDDRKKMFAANECEKAYELIDNHLQTLFTEFVQAIEFAIERAERVAVSQPK